MSFSTLAPRRLFTSADVLRMVEAGIVGAREPVELLDGELVSVAPQGPPHANVARVLLARLVRLYADRLVSRGLPLDAGVRSMPEPDISVVRGSEASFTRRHPRGDETTLVVEVAYSSHALDRAKTAIYARAGVPVYWLVDLTARRIEVHEEPLPDGRYRLLRVLSGSETVTPPQTDARWSVGELLPG